MSSSSMAAQEASGAWRATVATASVGAGLVGGVFFAFSTFVMTAIRRLPPPQGIAAMQAINKAAPTPAFMIPLFGTALVGAGLAVHALRDLDAPANRYELAGSAAALATCAVTVAFHVPRNEALAAISPSDPSAAAYWRNWVGPWTAGNHVRTLTSLAAAASWLLALRAAR